MGVLLVVSAPGVSWAHSDLDVSHAAPVIAGNCAFATTGTYPRITHCLNQGAHALSSFASFAIYQSSSGQNWGRLRIVWSGSETWPSSGVVFCARATGPSGETTYSGATSAARTTSSLVSILASETNSPYNSSGTLTGSFMNYWWYEAGSSTSVCSGVNDPGPPASAASDVPAPSCLSSRRLDITSSGTGFGRFTADAVVTSTHADDTWVWDFGDGSTDATTRRANHDYGPVTAQPDGGWTAEATITRTLHEGHLFEDDSEDPKTATCSVRVDFFSPELSDPTSSDDQDPDGDCPSGWGMLNPLNLLSTLKCLFIPTSDLGDSWASLVDEAETTWPLGPVLWGANTAVDAWAETAEAVNVSAETAECGLSVDLDLNFDSEVPNVDDVSFPLVPGSRQCFNWTAGPDETGASTALGGFMTTARNLSTVILVVGFALLMFKLGTSVFGGGSALGRDED